MLAVYNIYHLYFFQVYKYDKNLQLDHFLTAFVILALALVIGLGIGHFLGRLAFPPCSSQGQPNWDQDISSSGQKFESTEIFCYLDKQ